MKNLKITHKRMRPALGTFVEIESSSERTIGDAYGAISTIESQMSFFKAESEVGRFNALGLGDEIAVSENLTEVLRFCEGLYRESEGLFDISLGVGLIYDLKENKLRKIKEGKINLGGVAKGFAVDQAAKVLERASVNGIINAGGDMRFIGLEEKIHLRVPNLQGTQFYEVFMSEGAVATSTVSPDSTHIDTRIGKSFGVLATACVFAPTCMVADALTKIVFSKDERIISRILSKHKAQVLYFNSLGQNETLAAV